MWSSLHVYPVQNGSIGQVRNASVSGVYSIEEHTLNIDPSVAKSLNHTYPIWAGRHLFSFLIWGLKWSWWLDIYPILTHSHMSNPDIYLDTWTSRPLLTTYDTYTYIYGQRCMCIQLGYTSGYYLNYYLNNLNTYSSSFVKISDPIRSPVSPTGNDGRINAISPTERFHGLQERPLSRLVQYSEPLQRFWIYGQLFPRYTHSYSLRTPFQIAKIENRPWMMNSQIEKVAQWPWFTSIELCYLQLL